MKRIFFRSYCTVKRIIYFDENLRSNVKQNLHHNNFYTINAAEFRGIWDEIRIFLNKKKLQQSSRMQTSWPFFIATPNAIKFLQTSQKTLWTHTEFDFILEAFLRLILEMTDGCFSILQLFWGNLRFSPRLWTNTLHFNHVVLESELVNLHIAHTLLALYSAVLHIPSWQAEKRNGQYRKVCRGPFHQWEWFYKASFFLYTIAQ